MLNNNENFVKIGNREVLYFGDFTYKYTGGEHSPAPIPDEIKTVMDTIHEKFPLSTKSNSCLVTKYQTGTNFCPLHGDNSPFNSPTSDIFTFSIGAERVMKIKSSSIHTTPLDKSVKLKDNDLLVFSRVSQDFYTHEILPDSSVSQCRYSFTFRCLEPYNLNYTALIGDSNTQDISFGSGMGKLGVWLPGKRHKASKIKNIPGPHEIGPCRNVLLNVGINDLLDENPKSAKHLTSQLESKVKSILTVYPKTRIFISLLLPTKGPNLNCKVNELNMYIKQLVANHNNLNVIEHSNLVDSNGFLNPLLGRYRNGIPNSDDQIHLGASGLRSFVQNIKSKILYRKSSPTRRTQPLSSVSRPQHLQPTTSPPWSGAGSHASGPSNPPGLQFPPPPFPGWPIPPFPGPCPPVPFPSPQPSVGTHHSDRIRFNTQFPTLTNDGYQL